MALVAREVRTDDSAHGVERDAITWTGEMQHWVETFGLWLVFANVLALSLGLPVPALPTLILMGAAIQMHADPAWPALLAVLAVSVSASLIGDAAWYYAGRRYGTRTLQSLCRLSLSRDTCMKQTERFYGRFGVRVLTVAKFVPGLSMVSVPLAGAMQASLPRFLRYDGIGAALWAGLGLALGVIFARQVEQVILVLSQLGTGAIAVLVTSLAAYVAYRWWRRRSLFKSLETQRVDVAQLQSELAADAPPVILDIRAPGIREVDPYIIPGAMFADERKLEPILAAHPRERRIVIYCACPDEVSAAWMAGQLRRHGYTHVLPLRGGIDAWRAAGLPVTAISAMAPAAAEAEADA